MVVNPPSNLNWFRSASFAAIAVWAVFGAASCFAIYDSSTLAFTPVAMWASSWTTTLISAFWLAAPILLCPAIAAALGWHYLRGLGLPSRRWRAAWFSITVVGLVVGPLLDWSAQGYQFAGPGIDAPNPLLLLAGFLFTGAAMITILATSGRK